MLNALQTDTFPIVIKNENFLLLAEKVIYWESKKCLLIADLHIGKVSHFRKNNIAIPQDAANENFTKLEKLFKKWKPKNVYLLGDLFHSYYNKEWEVLTFLLAKFPKIKFILINGNHDLLNSENYKTAGIECYDLLPIGPFMLTHHPEEHAGYYNLCGHIHPGIRLKGDGKQYLRLPCFYFGEHQGILPAFGSFTGTATIKPAKGDNVIAIFNNKMMAIDTK